VTDVSVAATGTAAVAPANYAGSWTLDLAASKGLPPYYANVKSHKLAIAQDAAKLDVFVTIDAGRPAPDTVRLVYPLDGSESKTTTAVRTPAGLTKVPTTLKAAAAEDGGVHITIAREITMPDRTIKAITTEDWHLSADGRTLTVHRVDDSPRGRMEADMVFLKS
jgi:hypothetical protein